ncbi:hypothetical protein N7451_004515 [Penicillium sp. IBT 35674x]|nr:hypothetical protein N7451_004515 [Penicillium sp. IBT 35674x]
MTVSIQIDPADPHDSDHSLSDEDSSGGQFSLLSDGSHEYPDYDDLSTKDHDPQPLAPRFALGFGPSPPTPPNDSRSRSRLWLPGLVANHPQSHPVVQIRRNLPVTTHAILKSAAGPGNKPRATHQVFPRAPPTTTNIPRAMAHSPTRILLRLCLTSSFDSVMVTQMASHMVRPTHTGRPTAPHPCIPTFRSKHMEDILNSRPKPASTLTPINHYPLIWAPMAAAQEAAAKDEAIARLEKLILDDRTERENREAARLAAIAAEEAERLAREKQLAHDQAIASVAAAEAAALARADAEQRAATEAAKAKEEAEKAAAEAAAKAKEDSAQAAQDAATKALEAVEAANAAAAAAAAKAKEEEENKNKVPPPEKKKPIKFKDAVGRKFSFPFELCSTWQGMEDLIKQAFLHIEVIGPHVAEGHYDLVGPNGDIILPQVWETVVEPDWTITMHMWPIPEKPKEPDPPPAADPPPAEPSKPAEKKKEGNKKAPRKPGDPPAFTTWMMGRRPPPRVKKTPKAEKKDEPAPQ